PLQFVALDRGLRDDGRGRAGVDDEIERALQVRQMRLGAGQAAARAANRDLESVDEIADDGGRINRLRGVGLDRLFAYRGAVHRHLFSLVIERYAVVRQDGQSDVTVGLFDFGSVGRAVNGADVNGDRLDLRLADGDRIEQPVNDRERAVAADRPRIAPARDWFDAQTRGDGVRNHRQAGPGVDDESEGPFAIDRQCDERAMVDQFEWDGRDLFADRTMDLRIAQIAVEVDQPANSRPALEVGLRSDVEEPLVSVSGLVVILQTRAGAGQRQVIIGLRRVNRDRALQSVVRVARPVLVIFDL